MKLLYTDKSVNDYSGCHVVRVVFGPETPDSKYQALIKDLRKTLLGTWGYTRLEIHYNFTYPEAYIFFQDESDFLVFALKSAIPHKKVHMWPKGLHFTVYEFVESEE